MRRRIALPAILVVVATSATTAWLLAESWKPRPGDILMEERTTSLTLMCRNVPPDPLPYYWNWEGEFILSNMYKGDLELLIELELSDGREVQLPYPGAVLVPAGGSKTISFDAGFRTATSENLPEETYALVVRTELQRRCGSEVGTHVFEWRLEGFVNRTTWEPIVPEEIPAC